MPMLLSSECSSFAAAPQPRVVTTIGCARLWGERPHRARTVSAAPPRGVGVMNNSASQKAMQRKEGQLPLTSS